MNAPQPIQPGEPQLTKAPKIHTTTPRAADPRKPSNIKYSIDPSAFIVWLIFSLSLIGFGFSLYAFLHFKAFTSGEICNFSNTFSCDIVNRGPYSSLFGIPISLIGMLGYLFLAAAAFIKRKAPKEKTLTLFLVFASVAGFFFSLYLTFLEAFVIQAWCVICLTSFFLMLLIMLASFWLRSETDTEDSLK